MHKILIYSGDDQISRCFGMKVIAIHKNSHNKDKNKYQPPVQEAIINILMKPKINDRNVMSINSSGIAIIPINNGIPSNKIIAIVDASMLQR